MLDEAKKNPKKYAFTSGRLRRDSSINA